MNTSTIPATQSQRVVTVVGLLLIVIAGASLESFLLPALPHIQREFGVDAATGALAQVAPTLTTVIITPLAGRFADVFGARRTLAVLLAAVIAGGITSAFAPVFPVLVLGQVLQGFALGIIPVGFVVIRGLFDDQAIKTVGGLFIAMTVGGAGLGVLVAGPIIESTSRAVLFGVPTAIVVVGGVLFFAARAHLAIREQDAPTRIDWAGASVLALALVVIVAWLASTSAAGWLALSSLVLLVVALGLVVAWVAIERRVAQPMIDIATLRSRSVGGAVAVGVGIGAGYASIVYLIPQQITQPAGGVGLGATATQTGFFLAVAFGAGFLASPLAGKVAQRVGTRAVGITGMLVLALGAAIALISTAPALIVVALALAGVGAASASTVAFSSAASGAGEHEVGVSTALVTIARAVGGALATQVVASIITTIGVTESSAFRVGFAVAVVLALAGAGLAQLLPRERAAVDVGHGHP